MNASNISGVFRRLIPIPARRLYRRLFIERHARREANARRESHGLFLRNEYFPGQYREIQKSWSSRLCSSLEPLLLGFDPASRRKEPVGIIWDDAPHEVFVRPNTSDVAVLIQVYHERQYASALMRLHQVPDAAFIDCGANIGLAARFFLDACPGRRGVLVEPCRKNLEMCRLNTAPYATTVKIVPGAVAHADGLVFDLMDSGLLEWGLQCAFREGTVARKGLARTYTVSTLIDMLAGTPVGLVKMDIEGAEKEVFSKGDLSWLDRARNIAIEIHGDDCRRVIFERLSGRDFHVDQCGEITLLTDVRQSGQSAASAPDRTAATPGP